MSFRFGVVLALFSGLAAFTAAFGWVWWQQRMVDAQPETPVVQFKERVSQVPLKIVGLVAGGDGEVPLTCEHGDCRVGEVTRPEGAEVTDGTWWYFYTEEEASHLSRAKKVLQRQHGETGAIERIMESTPLTEPRDLVMSPDGTQLAFWLDNVTDPAEALTELWLYEPGSGVHLVAEKLYRPDVRSRVHWNSSSNYLFFVADTGERTAKRDQLELLVVNTESPGVAARFGSVLDVSSLTDDDVDFELDLSPSGQRVVAVGMNVLGQTVLAVGDEQQFEETFVRGEVEYVQWLEDDSLLYAVQDRGGFTFWHSSGSVHRFVARRPGDLITARGDVSGGYVVFAVADGGQSQRLLSLRVATGVVVDEGEMIPGEVVALLHVEQQLEEVPGVVAGVATEFDDAELLAFIEQSLPEIVSDSLAQPIRVIATDQTNTAFVDYRTTENTEARILLTVRDILQREWSIRGRYASVRGEWHKVQGGGLADPVPTRLYEWEFSLKRWILKQDHMAGQT